MLASTPWTIDTDMIGHQWRDSISIKDAEGGHVAHLTRGYEYDANGDGCPSWTNAHLIAAAPELLEALKDLLESHEDEWGVDKSTVRARAAIAKAEGKPK